MKKTAAFLLLIFFLVNTSSIAQVQTDSTYDHCSICTDHIHKIVYPYKRKFKHEIPFIITSGVTFGAGFFAAALNKSHNFTADQVNALDKNSINSFDRKATSYWSPSISKTSDYVLTGITILPAMFLLDHHTERDLKTVLLVSLEVFTFNYGVTTIAKNLSKRTRPYVYNGDVPIETRTGAGSRESFFSGHTSQTAAATFLFAKVISDYHPNLKPGLKTGMWIFAATVPALEGYLRVKAGKHFPTDVMAGYAIGAASGWLIPQLHIRKKYRKKKDNVGLGLLPYKDGMTLNMNIRL